ncbi:replication restart helicase PriA [Algisphaera agarilytica]|uniref:Replication restart protein PriA n=1 Tax=Algisphaera agarilytica TaxID=1385975 RepID=A0A7X0H7G9_9BACT|nr:primosomal protein N' [Algisphaera agarilytica]MBB6430700.1 primosomal protein N' (replication factor Y) [Algisphaera agarilytica]
MSPRPSENKLFNDDPSGAPPSEAVGYALVSLERSIDSADGGFTYAVPPELADLAVGDRVTVPLGRGNKPTGGIVVGLVETPDTKIKRIKPIQSRERSAASLPPDLVALAKWIAGYYCCPLGMTFASLLPAAVKRGTGAQQRTQVRALTPKSKPRAEPSEGPDPAPPKLTILQRAVLDAALTHQASEGWIDPKDLADLAGAKSTSPIKQLLDKGLLETRQHERIVSDLDLRAQRAAPKADQSPPQLTPAQATAVDRLGAALPSGFSVHVLHGITGSGKTEVYLRAIAALLTSDFGFRNSEEDPASDQANVTPSPASPPKSEIQNPKSPPPGVIVLVPEIALTPQTVGRFLARFPDGEVAVLHSGLTAAQRHAQWQRIRDGKARVVVGARSAIFAPLPRVGLIIVDEEHESSYKQDQLPRYHARDVAIKRAQLSGCPVVLGSATPSLESAYNAGIGGLEVRGLGKEKTAGAETKPPTSKPPTPKFHLIELPDRVPGAVLPKVEIVDLAQERQQRKGIHLLSHRLENALRNNLDAGGQAILLLNRRGYANYIACPDHRCGWMMRCNHCDVTMVYHRNAALPTGGVVRCHHCGAEQLLPQICPESGHKLTVFGLGTQRVEEELVRKFPEARLARMDADAMRTAKDYQTTLDAFARGDTDILLGTQMIAKGLDVANVRLVGVVSADTSLNFPDFRASERTFQLIAQVAGRAGRGEHRGSVIVQSFNPDDPAIQLAAQHDYVTFATQELKTRTETGLPPVGRMARIVLRDTADLANKKRAHQLAQVLHQANDQLNLGVRLRGPSVCPIARLADHHRQHIELIASPPQGATSIQKLLTALRNAGQLISDTHTAIDVDPVALL